MTHGQRVQNEELLRLNLSHDLPDERVLPQTLRDTALALRERFVRYNKGLAAGPYPSDEIATLLEQAALLVDELTRERDRTYGREKDYQETITRMRDSSERLQEWLFSNFDRAVRRGDQGGVVACERLVTDQAAPIWDVIEGANDLVSLGTLLPGGLVSITLDGRTFTLRSDGIWYEGGAVVEDSLIRAFLEREVTDLE